MFSDVLIIFETYFCMVQLTSLSTSVQFLWRSFSTALLICNRDWMHTWHAAQNYSLKVLKFVPQCIIYQYLECVFTWHWQALCNSLSGIAIGSISPSCNVHALCMFNTTIQLVTKVVLKMFVVIHKQDWKHPHLLRKSALCHWLRFV